MPPTPAPQPGPIPLIVPPALKKAPAMARVEASDGAEVKSALAQLKLISAQKGWGDISGPGAASGKKKGKGGKR